MSQQKTHQQQHQQQQQHHFSSYPLPYVQNQRCPVSNIPNQQFTLREQPFRTQRHRKHSASSKYHIQNPESPSSSTDEYQSKQSRYIEDPDSIEVYLENEPLKNTSKSLTLSRPYLQQPSKSNIVATMERYDPNVCSGIGVSSQTLPHHTHYCHGSDSSNPEYAYAYAHCEPQHSRLFEPQMLKQQQFIHSISPAVHCQKLPASLSSNALSKPQSTNSLRALLTKSFRKSSIGGSRDVAGPIGSGKGERHTFTTRYGTKENIYEDVGVGGSKLGMSQTTSAHQSNDSINKLNIEEEFRIVRNQHERIMGELNLSVEALLMPTQDETELLLSRGRENNVIDNETPEVTYDEANPMRIHQPTVNLNNCTGERDMDSGISGSSSSGCSASYSGSVRYGRTGYIQPPQSSSCSSTKTLTINECDPQKCVSLGSSDAAILMNSNKLSCCFYGPDVYKPQTMICQSQPHYSCGQSHHTFQPSPPIQIESISEKVNFWNRLGKMKLSGVFNSSQQLQQNSVNSQKQSQCDSNHPLDEDHAKWWKMPVCKSNRSQTSLTTPHR